MVVVLQVGFLMEKGMRLILLDKKERNQKAEAGGKELGQK